MTLHNITVLTYVTRINIAFVMIQLLFKAYYFASALGLC